MILYFEFHAPIVIFSNDFVGFLLVENFPLPGYEYDKGAQRDFYCYGCPNHIHNQRYEKGVEIEEQEPDVEKQSDSFVPLQLKNYPYPIVWIPPKYMKKYNESKVSSDQEIVPHNAKVPWKYEVF
ncbi:hypothetical protein Q3G72_012504 [Acer saccharum]|nr:hypothetical protein Q3G72_012504 [Acer saccharum]